MIRSGPASLPKREWEPSRALQAVVRPCADAARSSIAVALVRLKEATVIYASGCICGKHMLERANEGTCLSCGHGDVWPVLEHAYRLNMQAAPVLEAPVPLRPRVARTPRRTWDEDACVDAARAWEQMHGDLPTSADWQRPRAGEHRPSYGAVRAIFGGWAGFLRAIAEVPREAVAA